MIGTWKFRKRRKLGELGRTDLNSDEEAKYKPIEWPLIRRLLGLLLPYKKGYALGIALSTSMVCIDMTGPKFIAHLTDYATNFATRDISQHQAILHVLGVVGLWALAASASVMLQRGLIVVMTTAGESVQFSLRRKIFDQLQKLSMSYYDKTKLGRIISRCTSDVQALREVNVWGIHLIFSSMLMIGVSATMLLTTEPRMFLAVVWLAPVLFLMSRYFRVKAALAWQVAREGYTRVSTNLAENITGVRVVTAFNRQEPNLGKFNALQVQNTVNNIYTARVNGIYQPALGLVGFVGKVIIVLYGGYLVASGHVGTTIGSVLEAYLYFDWFMNPVIGLGNFHNQLMQAMAGAERIFNLLDMKPEVEDAEGAKDLARISGSVKFEDVTFGYNANRPILHVINFEAKPGQMVALVGHTGSGKSSIVSLIARFYQPQKGRVLVDGQDIRFVTGLSLHRQMGLVLQVNYLFSGTVMENVRYARPGATDEEVIGAARAVGSFDAIMKLQNGFGTEVGERGASMSLGQRQLICFTRAFLADPRIFMLDEATSAVDTETEMVVQRSLEKLLEGRTTFIVAHRLSTIMRSDCILVVDDGRIVERGTHSELIAQDGKYAHLYQQFTSQGVVD